MSVDYINIFVFVKIFINMISKDQVNKIVNDVSRVLGIKPPTIIWFSTFPKGFTSDVAKPEQILAFVPLDTDKEVYLKETLLMRSEMSLKSMIIHELSHIKNHKVKGMDVDKHGKDFQKLEINTLKKFNLVGTKRDKYGYITDLKTIDGKTVPEIDLTNPDIINYYKQYYADLKV